jgi:hypothetical protein
VLNDRECLNDVGPIEQTTGLRASAGGGDRRSAEGEFPASDPPQWTLGVENHCDDPKKGEPGDSPERERA